VEKLSTKVRVWLFVLPFVLLSSLICISSSIASQTLCHPQKDNAKSAPTLIVAGQLAQLPSVQWGIEQNCFRQFGLNVKTSIVATSTIAIAGLVGGSYDLAVTTPTNLIQAKMNGAIPGVFVAPRHEYTGEELVRAKLDPLYPGRLLLQTALIVNAKSPIQDWKDLENKTVAIQNFQNADHAGLLLAVMGGGGDSTKVHIVVLPSQQMGSALASGNVDGVIASEPFASQIIQNGGRVFGYTNAYFAEPGVAVGYASTTQIIRKKMKEMVAFRKATLFINHLLNDPNNINSYRNTIMSFSGITKEAAAKVYLQVMGEKNLTLDDIQNAIRKLQKVGFITGRLDPKTMLMK